MAISFEEYHQIVERLRGLLDNASRKRLMCTETFEPFNQEASAVERQFQNVGGARHVKVRVPVIVDADGRWSASSDDARNRDAAASNAASTADSLGYDHVRRIYWLYALVPVPDHDGHTVIGCVPQEDLKD